jgi:hypothetical protein
MLLNEIFDTNVEVKWSPVSSGHRGKFELDGDQYEIQIDDYELKLPSGSFDLVDVGFTCNGSYALTGKGSASKVFGAVFHALIPKLNELEPDIILFGVHSRNNAAEGRKAVYSKLGSWFSRGGSWKYQSEWLNTANGSYQFLAKEKPTEKDRDVLRGYAASIERKP